MHCYRTGPYARVPRLILSLSLLAALALPGAGCSKDKDKAAKDEGANAPKTDTPKSDTPKSDTDPIAPPASAAAPADGDLSWYRVVIESEQAPEVPFFIGFDGKGLAVVANGDERLVATGTVTDEAFEFYFPVLGTALSMKKEGDRYQGKWLAAFYFQQDFPAWAEKVERPSSLTRFSQVEEPPAAGVDVSGDWVAEVEVFGTAGAVFRQMPDGSLSGAMVPPDVGDSRYLSGQVSGNKLYMSSFDGMHSYLVEAELLADGSMKGVWSFTGVGRWPFTAKRGTQPGMESFVTVKTVDNARTVTIPELDNPPYKGNPVIVDYFGTWCPACLDLTPQLVLLHERHKDQGLQILAIALEVETDRAKVEQRIAEYKAKYNIPWDIQIRLVENFNDELPIEFDDVQGFPLTLFLRRDHTLAGMSTAFVSEAAPKEHKAMVAQFDAWAQEIVSSKAPAGTDADAKATK